MNINDAITEKLTNAQKKNTHKDTDIVSYSRKYKAAYKILVSLESLNEIESKGFAYAEKTVTKDAVYPKVDIEAERENGVSSGCLFMKVAIREAFPQNPKYDNSQYKGDEKRFLFVETANQIIEFVTNCKTLSDIKAIQSHSFFYQNSYRIKSNLSSKLYNLLRNRSEASYEKWGQALKYEGTAHVTKFMAEVAESKLDLEAIRFILSDLQNMDDDRFVKLIIDGGDYYDYERENTQLIRARNFILFQKLASLQESQAKEIQNNKAKFIDFCEKCEQELVAYLKEKLENFETEYEQDWSWLDKKKTDKKEQDTKAKPKDKPNFGVNEGLPLAHIIRKGGLKIKDISTRTIQKQFGFKNVAFGNYVTDREAIEMLNHFLGAVSDLFEILNLDPVAVNNIGGLSIGFGLTGNGGKAMATYSPTNKNINLTKRRGDGTVCHEWGHYFDNIIYLLYLKSENKIKQYASDNYFKVHNKVGEALKNLMKQIYRGIDAQKSEIMIFEAIKGYSFTIDTSKEFTVCMANLKAKYPSYFQLYNAPKNRHIVFGYIAQKYNLPSIDVELEANKQSFYKDSQRFGRYWIEPWELFTRAFEAYIFRKLDEKGRKNTYLVNDDKFAYVVYPQKREMDVLSPLFDELILAFKEQENIPDFKPFGFEREDIDIDLDAAQKPNKNTFAEILPILAQYSKFFKILQTV